MLQDALHLKTAAGDRTISGHCSLLVFETKSSFRREENKEFDSDKFFAVFNAALDIYYNSCASSGPKQD